MTPQVRSGRNLIRAASRSTRHVVLSFTAPVAPARSGRRAGNVALVLDRSGSMSGQKIRLAREAVQRALQMLHPDDRVTVVVYDNEIEAVIESTLASNEAKRAALSRLAAIDARGSTDLAGGWLRGCEQVAAHLSAETISRCLILTDGLANVGITDHDEIASHARALRDRGVSTSTFGVGADFDERLLQRMADEGGGHFYYIETAQQIPDLLTSELGEALEVVAREAGIAVQVPAGVEVKPLTRLEYCATDGGARVRLGDVVSGQDVEVVLALKFATGREGDHIEARFTLTDRDGVLGGPPVGAVWTYAGHEANNAQPRDRVVDRAVAALEAAAAREQAVALNREGRFEEARRALEAAQRRIRGYADDDAELARVIEALSADFAVLSAPMTLSAQKAVHFAASTSVRMRDVEGKAKRHPRDPSA